jgi:hypothetical protein
LPTAILSVLRDSEIRPRRNKLVRTGISKSDEEAAAGSFGKTFYDEAVFRFRAGRLRDTSSSGHRFVPQADRTLQRKAR